MDAIGCTWQVGGEEGGLWKGVLSDKAVGDSAVSQSRPPQQTGGRHAPRPQAGHKALPCHPGSGRAGREPQGAALGEPYMSVPPEAS